MVYMAQYYQLALINGQHSCCRLVAMGSVQGSGQF